MNMPNGIFNSPSDQVTSEKLRGENDLNTDQAAFMDYNPTDGEASYNGKGRNKM